MKIVIEGGGEVGSHLAQMLRAEANDVTVIDNDKERLERLATYTDVETVFGNPTSVRVLKEAGVPKADLFIAVYPYSTQEMNLVAAILARKLGAGKVLARINDEELLAAENKLIFKDIGIELMFYPERIAADEIFLSLKHNATTDTTEFAHGKIQISVFKVDEGSPVIDHTLMELTKEMVTEEEGKLLRIIALSRNEKTIIPSGMTKFRYGDLVYTISKREGKPKIMKLFGKTTLNVERVMIVGGSRIAEMVARSLCDDVQSIKIIEKDKERCIEISERLPDNVQVINGDGRNSDFLFDEGIRECDAFIALTGSDDTNVLSCVVAKKFGVPRKIAEVENIEYIHLADEMGVDTIINKKLITADRIFKFTLSGTAKKVKKMSWTDAVVIEYTAAPGSKITKAPLKNVNFPRNAIVGAIIRGTDTFIAVGESQIQGYDRVAVFALPQTVNEIDSFFI